MDRIFHRDGEKLLPRFSSNAGKNQCFSHFSSDFVAFSLKRVFPGKMFEIYFLLGFFLPTLRGLMAVIIVITKDDRRILWDHGMTVDVFHNFTSLCVHIVKRGYLLRDLANP